MSRIIKFRITYLEKEELEVHKGLVGYWTPEKPSGDLAYMMSLDRYAVSQFTGLQDRHGKDIYEGDICTKLSPARPINDTTPMRPFLVHWTPHTCGFNLRMTHSASKKPIEYEVLGSIYGNPELLNQIT